MPKKSLDISRFLKKREEQHPPKAATAVAEYDRAVQILDQLGKNLPAEDAAVLRGAIAKRRAAAGIASPAFLIEPAKDGGVIISITNGRGRLSIGKTADGARRFSTIYLADNGQRELLLTALQDVNITAATGTGTGTATATAAATARKVTSVAELLTMRKK